MTLADSWQVVWPLWQASLRDGDVVENLLHEDDADVDAFGYVGKELIDDVVDGIEGEAGCDALGGRGAITLDARNVKVREFSNDGICPEDAIIGDRFAGVAARDIAAADGIEHAFAEGLLRLPDVTRIL